MFAENETRGVSRRDCRGQGDPQPTLERFLDPFGGVFSKMDALGE